MVRSVLDTSVIIKSIFKPPKTLASESYKEELETHEKCRAVIKELEERDIDVYIPKPFLRKKSYVKRTFGLAHERSGSRRGHLV